MLKKFFISMLGTMAGLWLSLIIFSILCVALVMSLGIKALSGSDDNYKHKSILCVKLEGDIPEREPKLELIDILNTDDLGSETLSSIVAAIRKAATDDKIQGIFLDCRGSSMGIASREEVVQALQDFIQLSDKWIIAYADNYTQGDYYIASLANRIILNPVGSVDIKGLTSNTLFFKNLLDKIGVEMQVVKVGEYKSAVEPFIRTSMSEPSREQTSVFLNQIWNSITTEIAENLFIEPKRINEWADSLCFSWNPEKYLDYEIVTDLMYRQSVEDELKEMTNTDEDKELPLIYPSEYLSRNSMTKNLMEAGMDKGKRHIAVYYAVGDIVDTGNGGGIVGDKVVPDIEALAVDDNVAGLVLRVNSGGGSAFASEQIWNALERFKNHGKPFYVSMGDYAASGGYYISCGADSIFADAGTLTGSIGIFGLIPNAQKLLTDKIGINMETVNTNPKGDMPIAFKPMDKRQMDAMQGYVERGYETFVSRVAEGRNMTADEVKAIGGGRVWDGMTAVEIGLVDEIGSLTDAIDAMAQQLNMSKKNYVAYPNVEKEWFETLLNSGLFKTNAVEPSLAVKKYKQMVDYNRFLLNLEPIQARMEPIVLN